MDGKESGWMHIADISNTPIITALLINSTSGVPHPAHIIHALTTKQCQPKYQFPESCNRNATNRFMTLYNKNVLASYVTDKRDELDFGFEEPALVIFDVIISPIHKSVINVIYTRAINVIRVPAGRTVGLHMIELELIRCTVHFKYALSKLVCWQHSQYTQEMEKYKKQVKINKTCNNL
ncbi:unnamed protein product [Mytilus coruscus]|uniref:Uncharacterized protein n=1 Tax=Mytilus coruscus TaxID=42192 RepID=A0A6J7ZTA9_MYTCO|nr:unnamed protein product [Mytilus coruscus]